jgi:hypothetical protein
MVDEDTELKDSVQRLHRFIVDAVRARRGDPFATPVTVSEIYQELAPYRTVRSTLGFEMNADYEHALVRMLSGVDGLTRLDPAKARERLAKELASPNPDVTLYRDYAACDVVLNPPGPQMDWVREQLDDDDDDDEDTEDADGRAEETRGARFEMADVTSHKEPYKAPDWSALADLSNSEHLDEEEETQDVEERSTDETNHTRTDPPFAETRAAAELETNATSQEDDVMEMKAAPIANVASTASSTAASSASTASSAPTASSAATASCAYCDSALPAHRQTRFCPFCGADQSMQPCPACGEAIEPGWAFCIACGTGVASRE